MYHPILRSDMERQLKNIKRADLVIGLPSYKNSHKAAHVAGVALAGAQQYYPELRTVLINADAGLEATTRQAVIAQTPNNGHHNLVLSGRYEGVLGQGSAVAALLDAALALDAQAIIILDSQTTSITPKWAAALAHLILKDKADLVMPRYRQWFTPLGILSDLIVYPLFRALWGQSMRRPAAPDFALSPQLATTLLDQDVWGTAVATFGLSPWLTSYSIINNKWRVAQTALGEKQLTFLEQEIRQTTEHKIFKAAFQDTLTVLFYMAHKYKNEWQNFQRVRLLPTLTHFATAAAPLMSALEEDTEWLLDKLALGWIEYRVLWQYILTPDNLSLIEALASLPADRFYFPADLWAKIIYDFVLVFNKGHIDPAKTIASLLPLYQGRLAAFQQETAGLNTVAREGTVAAQAVEFEESRDYLIRRWQTYHPSF